MPFQRTTCPPDPRGIQYRSTLASQPVPVDMALTVGHPRCGRPGRMAGDLRAVLGQPTRALARAHRLLRDGSDLVPLTNTRRSTSAGPAGTVSGPMYRPMPNGDSPESAEPIEG